MKATYFAVAAASLIVAACYSAASADRPGPGAKAPPVVLQSVIGGKVEKYDLQSAVAHGPVVLYFFPAAFTAG